MITAPATSLQSFQHFVSQQLASNPKSSLSPEEALALWWEEEATLEAIREGLADIEAGRTKSLEEFDRDFCQRHGI